jgi:polyribonucleotide nucleotidyltransferase
MEAPVTGTDEYSSEAVLKSSLGERTIRFEAGRLAQQAAGSVVTYLNDDTMILSATTASKNPKDNLDFFPLTVDVEERQYAAGKIPGSFFRREGRPSEDAILTCRLTDRPLRPSFAKGLRNEIQIVSTIMALDPDHMYDVLAINGAAASVLLAGLPFSGPVAAARVALIDGEWIPFPTYSELEGAVFDMVVAGRVVDGGDVAIMMVEAEATVNTIQLIAGGAQAPTEEIVAQGLEASKPFLAELCAAQQRLADSAAKPTRDFPVYLDYADDAYDAVAAAVTDELAKALTIADKQEREAELDRIKELAKERTAEALEGREKEVSAAYRSLTKKLVRQRVIKDGVRIDGRGVADIRTLSAEIDVVPRVHGSALFERGETQILNVSTLNMLRMEQMVDTLNPETRKRYMHHYNFPPYSTGETGRVGSPKRREIGHGALAERALVPVLPSKEEFPYAIRAVSEALGSNGSTSMGSVCASTLSLMAAGVPLKAAVAGIAMGLINEGEDFVTLTDILGAEDAYGDMDFKVAGTRDFVTALQLDTKLTGIPASVLGSALQQARDRRARRDVGVRAADHHRADPGRQDRRDHRAEGQDHQPDPGRHRCGSHGRRRRHDLHCCCRWPQGRGRASRGAFDRVAAASRGRRALPGHRGQDHDVRCVHLAHAGQGRSAPHLTDPQDRRRQASRERRRRPPGWQQGPGADRRDRPARQALPGPRPG